MRKITRPTIAAGLLAAAGLALPGAMSVANAAAGTHVKPTITSSTASFTIPAGSSAEWAIRLWSQPTGAPETLVGQDVNSSGTITVAVPTTANCTFQVDVKTAPLGTTKVNQFKWYSGVIATVADCGGAPH